MVNMVMEIPLMELVVLLLMLTFQFMEEMPTLTILSDGH